MDVVVAPFLHVVLILLDFYTWIIITSIILSWLINFNVVNIQNRLVYAVNDFVYRATEPALNPIRRALPNLGNLDFSPMVLILGIIFLKGVIQRLYLSIG
jgi:YggT family protein